MNKQTLQIFAQVFLFFFLATVVIYGFRSLTTLPAEGDSLAYHIPIAKSVLDGTIFHPTFYLGYYPSTAELVLSLFLLLGIPLNLFNIICLVILFPVAKKFGIRFGLQNEISIVFSITVCLLPTMLRWLSAQIIDIWLLVFYMLCLILLQKPERTMKYFLLLGIAFGLLIGVKYSGPLFAIGLAFVYIRQLLPFMRYRYGTAFFIPLVIFGFSWYIRNTLLQHNPIYPQPLFSLPGISHWNIFDYHEWEIIVRYPTSTLNALFAEYFLWFLSPFLVIGLYLYNRNLGRFTANFRKLVYLGIFNLLVFFFLPTTPEYNIIVSSIRYSYPAFVIFMLALFLYSQSVKKEEWITLFALSGMLFLPSLSYRPKLLLVFLTLLFLFYIVKKVIIRRL